MAKRYAREVREEVLGKIRGGQKVADVARVYGIKKEEFSRLPTLEN